MACPHPTILAMANASRCDLGVGKITPINRTPNSMFLSIAAGVRFALVTNAIRSSATIHFAWTAPPMKSLCSGALSHRYTMARERRFAWLPLRLPHCATVFDGRLQQNPY